MEPTIYKPSIYKGAGIYKTGAEGGGGGGGEVFFHKKYALLGNIEVDPIEHKLKISNFIGLGGFVLLNNNAVNVESIEINLCKYYAANTGGTGQLFGYFASNSNYNDGRVIQLFHNYNGEIEVRFPNSSTSWRTTLSFRGYTQQKEYDYKFTLTKSSGSDYLYKVFVDGNLIASHTGPFYANGLYRPLFMAEDTYKGKFPGFYGLHADEYVNMDKTYMRVNDELIMGYE